MYQERQQFYSKEAAQRFLTVRQLYLQAAQVLDIKYADVEPLLKVVEESPEIQDLLMSAYDRAVRPFTRGFPVGHIAVACIKGITEKRDINDVFMERIEGAVNRKLQNNLQKAAPAIRAEFAAQSERLVPEERELLTELLDAFHPVFS